LFEEWVEGPNKHQELSRASGDYSILPPVGRYRRSLETLSLLPPPTDVVRTPLLIRSHRLTLLSFRI
jgi:hypothetical protein